MNYEDHQIKPPPSSEKTWEKWEHLKSFEFTDILIIRLDVHGSPKGNKLDRPHIDETVTVNHQRCLMHRFATVRTRWEKTLVYNSPLKKLLAAAALRGWKSIIAKILFHIVWKYKAFIKVCLQRLSTWAGPWEITTHMTKWK